MRMIISSANSQGERSWKMMRNATKIHIQIGINVFIKKRVSYLYNIIKKDSTQG